MGIDLTDKLVETAQKVATTRNEYGDIVYGTSSDTACLYRDISSFVRGQQGAPQPMETVLIDGLLWFDADEDVAKGDIYYHSSEGYLRIERITKAKRLVVDNSRQFIKCEVTRQRQIS